MNYDEYGEIFFSPDDVINEMYRNPDVDITKFTLDTANEEAEKFGKAVSGHYDTYSSLPSRHYVYSLEYTVEDFDRYRQSVWHMPDEYHELDIAEWLLSQCQSETELQRVGEELLLYQERNMMPLLNYLKYFVDTMRENNKVWGVGRGSSVASYVLFLIGVHKIDSLYYGLSINEFLR